MPQAKPADTTNVVAITSSRRFVQQPNHPKTPYAELQRTPETILLAALLWSLREGNDRDRGLFLVVKGQVAKGAARYCDDPGFDGARHLLEMIDAAAYDAEQG